MSFLQLPPCVQAKHLMPVSSRMKHQSDYSPNTKVVRGLDGQGVGGEMIGIERLYIAEAHLYRSSAAVVTQPYRGLLILLVGMILVEQVPNSLEYEDK